MKGTLIANPLIFPCFIAGKLMQYLKENKCIVIHKCTAIRHAKVNENITIYTQGRCLTCLLCSLRHAKALTSSASMALSVRHCQPDFFDQLKTHSLGAGHPGEDDIGGLVLVRLLNETQ